MLAVSVGYIRTNIARPGFPRLCATGPLLPSDASRVGHNEEAIAAMTGAERRRRDAIPLRIVPAAGQVPENFVHPSSKEPWDVFHDDVGRSKYANEPRKVRPEPARVVLASLPAGVADGLAGEASSDDIDGGELATAERGDVGVSLDLGPVFREDLAALGVVLDLPGDTHPGELKPSIEAADSREERANT
jgi:hypothetical protein